MRELTIEEVVCVDGGFLRRAIAWVAKTAAGKAAGEAAGVIGEYYMSDQHNQNVSDFSSLTGENYYGHSNNGK